MKSDKGHLLSVAALGRGKDSDLLQVHRHGPDMRFRFKWKIPGLQN